MSSRYKHAGYTVVAALGLFVGAAGIAAAATGTDADTTPVVTDEVDDADDSGVNCENGIDSATGDECDGGPAAAQAEEATEVADNEADEAETDGVDHQFEGEETGENGDGMADADDATEAAADD